MRSRQDLVALLTDFTRVDLEGKMHAMAGE